MNEIDEMELMRQRIIKKLAKKFREAGIGGT